MRRKLAIAAVLAIGSLGVALFSEPAAEAAGYLAPVATLPAATPSAAPSPTASPPESLTDRAAALQALLDKTDSSLVDYSRLRAELELVRHQMGPYDAAGRRVHCQAMWHDAEIVSLENDVKRLSLVHDSAANPADDLRLAARRMAAACLLDGWRIPDGRIKFQVDAFGSYLANNPGTLDALFTRVQGWMTAAAKPDESKEDAAAHQAAVTKARQGIDAMGLTSVEALTKVPPGADEALVPLLADFMTGLRTVYEADESVRDRAAKKPGAAATATAAELEPPPMTDDETARLAAIRQGAAKLTGEGWAAVAQALGQYAGAVETGLQVPAARPRAREFLRQVERAGAMAAELAESKAIYPEYLKAWQVQIAFALTQMGAPATRARGYATLDRLWDDDELRRQVERSGAGTAAKQGITYAYYIVWEEETARAGPKEPVAPYARVLRDACRQVADTLEKMRTWPPKDMVPRFRELYGRQEKSLLTSLDQVGAADAADRPSGYLKLVEAATRAGDLERIIRADAALKTAMKYRPARATVIGAALVQGVQALVSAPEKPETVRQTLEGLIAPLESLARIPAFDAADIQALPDLARLQLPMLATERLAVEAAAGIDAMAAGDPLPLQQAVTVRPLFVLAKHVAATGVYRLDAALVSNLTTFSISEKAWGSLVRHMDPDLRDLLEQYVKEGQSRGPWDQLAGNWDDVYLPVTAARRLTLNSRTAGENELDLLLRNLENVAVPNPSPETWHGWAAGYHATEAAMCLVAGLDAPAEWHLLHLRSVDGFLRTVDLAPAKSGAVNAPPVFKK
jgi:hypothetical protein